MTKKDYEVVARAIKLESDRVKSLGGADTGFGLQVLRSLGQNLCNEMRADNERFNSDKFLTACGL